jgi:uncharacterized protein YjbJ (UPF0337 family)
VDCVSRKHSALKPRLFENDSAVDCLFSQLANQIALKENQSMKRSTKDKSKGKFHVVKGKVKESIGRMTKNPKLEAEGQGEQLGGKIKKKIGQVEKALGI